MKVVNDELLQNKLGFIPHSAQAEAIKGMKRFTVIAAGRRTGKSKLAAYFCYRELLTKGKKIWVVAPTYDLTKKVINYIIEWAAKCHPNFFKITMNPNPVIRSNTGSILEGKTADNVYSLMGEELDLLIVDEAAALPKEVWEQYLYPTLSIRKGKAILISTPKGMNWFYELYGRAQLEPESFSAFTYESRANPLVTQEEWEAAERNLPKDVFDQEYRADFLSDAAAVFRNIYECVKGELEEPQKDEMYVMGVDLGKFQDFTVLTVVRLSDHHVVFFDRFQKLPWPIQKERIINTAKEYNNALVSVDSTGKGDPIADDLEAAGLSVRDFKYSTISKSQLITKLSLFLEQGKISFPHLSILINELNTFGYTRSKSGNYIYGPFEGKFDDCVNSLALAVFELYNDPLGPDGKAEPPIMFPTTDY